MTEARVYRFSDANRPGVVLGLSARQATPTIAGILVLAVALQTPLPPVVGLASPIVGALVAFGQWRGTPIADTLVPGVRLGLRRLRRRERWLRPSLVGDNTDATLPRPLRGLELLATADGAVGVVRDRTAGWVTAVVRVQGQGFPLASRVEQDAMLAGWGAALSPFARDRSPVCQVVWHEWAHPVAADGHRDFLDTVGIADRAAEASVADYQALVAEQAPVSFAHEVLVAVTVDQRRVRVHRDASSRLASAVETLTEEIRLFTRRLDAAGITVAGLLDPTELAAAVRVRSDPRRGAQLAALSRSLAAAAGRGGLEWGPMALEDAWSHVHVDGAFHRAYRIASWPQLPVGADWLSGLLVDTACTRTVTVVAEPIPMRRAARAADREVMAREADADMKTEKGFRVNARERKRLADVEARERELSEGHAEFRFAGIVTVTADALDRLDRDCADVEQAAAQSLLDLRALDARHDQGWVASLPLGRVVAPGSGPR